jgi:predicted 3-demethylubiquinone-9 3-methyltransferase (glyoxalase superfamily)
MTYCVPIKNGIMTFCETDFKCPKCECQHEEEDYFEKLDRSKKGLIYIKCKGCKTKLGVSFNIMGDVVAWLKEEEKK